MPKVKKIYKGNVQVWPAGWTPGANTLLYLPLNSTDTYTDKSGNNRGTTNYSVAFGTYQGVNCAYFNNAHIQVTPFQIPTGLTFLVWFYRTGFSYPNDGKIFDARTSPQYIFAINGGSEYTYGYCGNTVISSGTLVENKWCLYCMTSTGSSATLRLLGNNINTTNTSSVSVSAGTPSYINIGNEYNNAYDRYFLGYLSNLILENRVWTSDEITAYYNQTKDNYQTSQGSPSSCFLAGTPVLIEGGSKPIDELNIGDAVLSYNKSTGEKEYNKVVDIIEHTETKDLLYTLDIEGQRIEATEFHKFYISDNKEDWRWEEIRNLKEGQFVFSILGAKKINSVESKKFDGPCYNITVDNNHNYFVYDGILVHNAVSAS